MNKILNHINKRSEIIKKTQNINNKIKFNDKLR